MTSLLSANGPSRTRRSPSRVRIRLASVTGCSGAPPLSLPSLSRPIAYSPTRSTASLRRSSVPTKSGSSNRTSMNSIGQPSSTGGVPPSLRHPRYPRFDTGAIAGPAGRTADLAGQSTPATRSGFPSRGNSRQRAPDDGPGARWRDGLRRNRGAEDVRIAERWRAVSVGGRLGDRRARAQRLPPRVQGWAISRLADVVPHADRPSAGGCGVHVVAEELRGEVVLGRGARVTDVSPGERAERADRAAGHAGVQDHADQAPL